MEENRFTLAGWLAILQAVLFPVGFIVGILQTGIGNMVAGTAAKPVLGPSEAIFVIFTGIGVYTLLMFRRLLNERYNNHELDILIVISIAWGILFQAVTLGSKVLVIAMWPVDEIAMLIGYVIIMTASMVSIGIVDILIGIRLLKVREVLSDPLRVLAYVSLVAGICEITVLLAPLALLMIPVSLIVLAIAFLHDSRQVEFV